MNRHLNAIPLPTIKRLPLYMGVLRQSLAEEKDSISSSLIAEQLGFDPVQVRKDLAGIGITGQPRIGFPVSKLIDAIEDFLGWNNVSDSFIIGAGNLGTALAGFKGFAEHGLKIVALFDNDPANISRKIHGKQVFPISKLADLTSRLHVRIAILTVSEEAAQETANLAVEAGIKAIWNFTPVKLIVPDDVIVERVDLSASLAVLSSKLASALKAENQMKEVGSLK